MVSDVREVTEVSNVRDVTAVRSLLSILLKEEEEQQVEEEVKGLYMAGNGGNGTNDGKGSCFFFLPKILMIY